MKRIIPIIAAFCTVFAVSCRKEAVQSQSLPVILPDYTYVTIPSNIAPLNFNVPGARKVVAEFSSGESSFKVKSGSADVKIPCAAWRRMLKDASEVEVKVTALTADGWTEYKSFIMTVKTPVDDYVAYRLIEPGYEVWNEMGIYQRNLTNFSQRAIVTNKATSTSCMNCHSFCNKEPEKMVFHLRANCGGTYVVRDGGAEKLNTKTPETISALVYPQWHPSGKFIAFSTNTTAQHFHTLNPNRIEVYDSASDVVVYDVENHTIFSCPQLKDDAWFETFPTFSPDGRKLYFCTAARKLMPYQYSDVHYNLCAIDFDPDTKTFGEKVDTLVDAASAGMSVAMPRVSPDGKLVMFTLTEYGNFTIWHKDADLCVYNVERDAVGVLDGLNSPDVDSYHSWSTDGRWVVFASKRVDKLYTRLFIAYVGPEGTVGKPFMLPQKRWSDNQGLLVAYNIPEFVTGRVSVKQPAFTRLAHKDKGINLSFE